MLRQMERSAIQWLTKRGKCQRAIARELRINWRTVARVLEEPVDKTAVDALCPRQQTFRCHMRQLTSLMGS